MATLAQPSNASFAELPLLEAGAHIDQPTFHQRYLQSPRELRAELIQGVVFVPSPTRFAHSSMHARIVHWLGEYVAHTPGTDFCDNASVILDGQNELQPDALLLLSPVCGGRLHKDADDTLRGIPELIVEIASSSEAHDLFEKKDVYERAGVPEYIVVTLRTPAVHWFEWTSEGYSTIPPEEDGSLRSRVFPGLWLPAQGSLLDNHARRLEVLRAGLASEEHTNFVSQLSSRMARE